MLIPIDQINTSALPRDRTTVAQAALQELQHSIAANGLRHPIEVFEYDGTYNLISGYRRLTAFQALHAATQDPAFARIPATVLKPVNRAQAIQQMVEENDLHEGVSPWDHGRIIVTACEIEEFDSHDGAIAGLFPFANRQKRGRLRMLAEAVDALSGLLADPETISQNRLIRLATCMRLGWEDLIITALTEAPEHDAAAQWAMIEPVLRESENAAREARAANKPMRLCRPGPGLTIRRERTEQGYLLHITGPDATSQTVHRILDQIEAMFATTG